MHDLKWIRQNANIFDAKLAARKLEPMAQQVLDLDSQNRALINQINQLYTKRNIIADHSQNYNMQGLEIKQQLKALVDQQKIVESRLKSLLYQIPNLPQDDVSSEQALLIETWGEVPQYSFVPKSHYDLFTQSINFNLAANIAGTKFVVLQGQLAELERGLSNFMLDVHTQKFGFQEVSIPLLVKSHAMYGTCQLPKFQEDQFSTQDDLWLVPTAEVALTNLYCKQILAESVLPKRFVASSACFRKEAGAAGQDTQGLIRLHQFYKVELVSLTTAEQSLDELDYITNCAKEILRLLGIPYRIISLPAWDLGFAASKTYDIEAYFASQQDYREVSSCSYCATIQSRRMQIRYKNSQRKNELVHTLNGSALAVGRTLAALVECYQQSNGTVQVPPVLQPYLQGKTLLDMEG